MSLKFVRASVRRLREEQTHASFLRYASHLAKARCLRHAGEHSASVVLF